jgi:hypothetical protein
MSDHRTDFFPPSEAPLVDPAAPPQPGFPAARSEARTGGNPVPGGALGIYTKFASPEAHKVHAVDTETGEIVEFKRKGVDYEPVPPEYSHSVARWSRFDLLDGVRRIMPKHRTASCLWCRVSTNNPVQVVKDLQSGRARYGGLRVCSRVWTCPVCAAKISERRAVELAQSIGVARSQGVSVALLTVTVPHIKTDALKPLLERLSASWRRFTSGKTWESFKQNIGFVGTIRNIEVTHGANGWHPHFHCLVFYTSEVELQDLQRKWGQHWQRCAVACGLSRPSDQHGLTIQNGDFAASYVSKWGLEHEMTKSMAKTARKGGRTPMDMVRDFLAGTSPKRDAALFREFAEAFHGMQQLRWSRGLKARFMVEDKDDETIVAEEENRAAELVVQLTWPEWVSVRRHHRATLLDLAEEEPHLIPVFLQRCLREEAGRGAVAKRREGGGSPPGSEAVLTPY